MLRILSMMMVIGLHYLNREIGGGLTTEYKMNIISTHILESICITSVNVFVLISGYFMASAKTTGLRKAVDLYLIMLFYNLISFCVSVVSGQYQFFIKALIYAFFPFLAGLKWFLETYIILLLFAPFINKLLNSLNRKAHLLLIVIQLLLFSIWPSFLPDAPILDKGYGITHFITLYLISSYIKKYISFEKCKKIRIISLVVFFASCSVITASSFIPYLKDRAWDYCYIFNIIASVSLFVLFLNLPKTNISIINTIAATTFGVYITHTMLYFQPLIYHTILHTELYYDSPFQTVHFLLCVVILFSVCSIIDYCRNKLWTITMKKLLDNSKLLNIENEWESRFM